VKEVPVPKCNQRAVNKYNRENYDRLNIMVPKGERDIIKAHAAEQGESLNAFVNRAIDTIRAADKGYFIITEAK